ncbi:hypothetical protein HanRHA438_Chr17g0814531 [Helianthus annuus]|uniref:Uncharacterized protein n=1 Tax=Helianthus annuus TaxID=4232 RepID=A0A251RRT5_HELAN|nr:hypothetical protein HanXRQr2_Chr17g0806751 [Helianthus annuus]KAJ0813308.1 hypothetical protein HanPSC8_Chr17g0771921 [Helianthus annuus]KAJ0826460.1 hypothetical protein HanRHA438_Chr17g0814531 [Helianthus annuus]
MKFCFVSMAYIHMRSVSIFIFIVAIFILQFLFITADQSGNYRIDRNDPRTPPSPKGNPPRSMIPPESGSPPPPAYT